MCDFSGSGVAKSVLAVIIGVEWSCERGSMVLKVEDVMLASMDGAKDGVPREPVSKCFPMGCVHLVSVGKGDVYPRSLHIM